MARFIQMPKVKEKEFSKEHFIPDEAYLSSEWLPHGQALQRDVLPRSLLDHMNRTEIAPSQAPTASHRRTIGASALRPVPPSCVTRCHSSSVE